MKNTIENKARFFGNHLGATICYPSDGKIIKAKLTSVGFEEIQTTYFRRRKSVRNTYCVGDLLSWKSNGNHKCDALNAYIELTPLSQITDEDARRVTQIMNTIGSKIGSGIMEAEDIKENLAKHPDLIISHTADYLRSKSYALPFNDITVEEQIEFGWIKLKTK